MSVFKAQKMKFSIKDFFSRCDQNFPVDLVILTEEILNRKLHFCAVIVNLNKVLIWTHNVLTFFLSLSEKSYFKIFQNINKFRVIWWLPYSKPKQNWKQNTHFIFNIMYCKNVEVLKFWYVLRKLFLYHQKD